MEQKIKPEEFFLYKGKTYVARMVTDTKVVGVLRRSSETKTGFMECDISEIERPVQVICKMLAVPSKPKKGDIIRVWAKGSDIPTISRMVMPIENKGFLENHKVERLLPFFFGLEHREILEGSYFSLSQFALSESMHKWLLGKPTPEGAKHLKDNYIVEVEFTKGMVVVHNVEGESIPVIQTNITDGENEWYV